MHFNPKLPLYAGAFIVDSAIAARLVESDGRILSDVKHPVPPVAQTTDAVLEAVKEAVVAALRAAGLAESLAARTWVGMGLPPAQVAPAVERLTSDSQGLAGAAVAADLHVLCLGAHGGPEGGIIEADISCRGLALPRNIPRYLGGGWPVADHGSLAALGRAALSDTLDAVDGLSGQTGLTADIEARFDDRSALLATMTAAVASDVAALGRLVLAKDGDCDHATRLLDAAAERITAMADRLAALGAQSIVMTGALGPALSKRRAADRFAEAKGDGCDGALTLVRRMTNPLSHH